MIHSKFRESSGCNLFSIQNLKGFNGIKIKFFKEFKRILITLKLETKERFSELLNIRFMTIGSIQNYFADKNFIKEDVKRLNRFGKLLMWIP